MGEYVTKFEYLSKFSTCHSEEWKCRMFKEGLSNEIKEVVMLEIREFHELLHRCSRVEEVNKSREESLQDSRPLRVKRRDNKFKQKPYARPMDDQQFLSALGSGEGSNEWYGKAHDVKTCPVKGLVCFGCKKPGHYAWDCN